LETTALNDAARAAVRATNRRAPPGSSSAISETISSGAAPLPALRSRVWVLTWRRMRTGSVMPTGRPTVTNEMRLPIAPFSPVVRMLTGTRTLTVAGCSPRRRSARPMAIVEAASRTSLIVAPWRRPVSRAPSSEVTPRPTARRAVAERFSAVAGAGAARWRTAVGTSTAWPTVAAAERAARAAPTTRLRANEAAAAGAEGGACGCQRAGVARSGSWPAASKSNIATSTAAIPSTSA
jgi:hypothetical protein